MRESNNRYATANRLGTWLMIGATLVTACSLTVPSESALFGSPHGGAAAISGAPSSEGGSPHDEGGTGGTGFGEVSGAGRHDGGAGNDSASGGGNVGGGADTGGPGGAAGEAGEAEGGAGGEPSVPIDLPPAVLMLRYDFDDLTQLIAKDISGNGQDGTLAGLSLPGGVAGHIAGALSLNGAQKQYVQLPTHLMQGFNGVSIASWIKLSQALAWDRLFDFNAGESEWFYFSPTGWNDTTKTFGTRCATRTTSTLAPEIEMTATIPINEWHHVAVVFAKPFLRYYLDGVLQSEQSDVSFGPDSLGDTNQNWIGRSVYAADPYLTGQIDEFRVYSGALTAAQVADLAAQ